MTAVASVILSTSDCIDVIMDGNLLASRWWLLGGCCPGIVTPSSSPYKSIMSISGHGCPHPSPIVRPSAWLPAMRFPPLTIWYTSPDLCVDRMAAFSRAVTFGSRYMAQLGKTASRITSHGACSGNKILVTVDSHMGTYMYWLHNAYLFACAMMLGCN